MTALEEAREVRRQFDAELQTLRADNSLTPMLRARKILRVWKAARTRARQLREEFDSEWRARRRRHLDRLLSHTEGVSTSEVEKYREIAKQVSLSDESIASAISRAIEKNQQGVAVELLRRASQSGIIGPFVAAQIRTQWPDRYVDYQAAHYGRDKELRVAHSEGLWSIGRPLEADSLLAKRRSVARRAASHAPQRIRGRI